MTIIDALTQLMSCEIVDGRSASEAIIEEHDVITKLTKVTISELKPGIIILKIDAGRKVMQGGRKILDCMSPLFNISSSSDHNCACDAVIVHEQSDGDCGIAYIELKSDSPTGYAGQFKSTRCFMRYIAALLHDLFDVPMHIKRERFIVVHTDSKNAQASLGKRPTRFAPADANSPNAPEKYIVRDKAIIRCTAIL